MLRWLATLVIAALLALAVGLPSLHAMRRGNEARVRTEVAAAAALEGQPFPDIALPDVDGEMVRISDLRGHRVLLTFERSVDW